MVPLSTLIFETNVTADEGLRGCVLCKWDGFKDNLGY